jgi:hypothetical protein
MNDDQVVALRAGDVLVQRGTFHTGQPLERALRGGLRPPSTPGRSNRTERS